ncbi:uncharacterized protein LOC116185798 isoform X1 [Apis dorsata]|uniref:uncharacterized protein LOC116185798 isoform X1 n=1 Tax=Apis dorsata TaxID=7462 RepID=UPI001293EB83|nr:uncharacterized protein LOC116185798 isoform X1 [Apis dorsata]
MVGVSKGRVWPVVVTTEPYQCEAGYQPPNIEVGVTLVYVTRLPQAPTHIYLRHPCTDSRGFSCRGLGEQRDLRTVHAGNPFRLSTGGQPFSMQEGSTVRHTSKRTTGLRKNGVWTT